MSTTAVSSPHRAFSPSTIAERRVSALSTGSAPGGFITNANNIEGTESRRASEALEIAAGMRREWNFTLTFAHQAARLLLQCSPQWEHTFIDPERIGELNRLDRDVRHCPMTPALRYTDFSAVLVGGSVSKGGGEASATAFPASGGSAGDSDAMPNSLTASCAEAADGLWLEKAKHVEVLYSHIPPDMTLSRYCIDSVQHILKDPQVISIDGDTDLTHLRLGSKLRCPHHLGGHRSFHFYFRLKNKSELMNDSVYAIGTIANQRGYLVLVRCAEDEELDGYLQRLFLPFYSNPSKCSLDAEVTYGEVASVLPAEQLERQGELRYEDRDAAISFSLPMYPMRVRPDFSPAKTVGVGSIACMTLELNVYERLIDDMTVAELTGMPKYKVNQVVLCLDVEDVSRMGYPSVMSTEQYSDLKTRRLLDVFPDAKVVGLPTSVRLGHRVGRSRIVTFAYEPLNAVAKAMLVSTLVGNFGVTALYLTKLGGGVFDTHLYLYQRLLNGVLYHQQNTTSSLAFSRHHVTNIRLLEPDLHRAYATAPAGERATMERHVTLMRASNDGKVEGGVVVVMVPPEEGGIAPRFKSFEPMQPSAIYPASSRVSVVGSQVLGQADGSLAGGDGDAAVSYGAATSRVSARKSSIGFLSSSGVTSTVDPAAAVDSSPTGTPRIHNVNGRNITSAASNTNWRPDEIEFWEVHSTHSDSLISVTSISRLQQSEYDDYDGFTFAGSDPQDTVIAEGDAGDSGAVVPQGAGLTEPDVSEEKAAALEPTTTTSAVVAGETATAIQSNSPTQRVSTALEQAPTNRNSSFTFTTTMAPESAMAAQEEERRAVALEEERRRAAAAAAAEADAAEIKAALQEDGADIYFGPSLRDVYVHCCEAQQCRPNSYLLTKLPASSRLTNSVAELDLTSNYLGHNGFVAVLSLLAHLPNVKRVYFNDMSLDNTDAQNLSEMLIDHPSITAVHVRNNPKITLPATRHFTRLLRSNPRLLTLALDGTRLGETVIERLEAEAAAKRAKVAGGDDEEGGGIAVMQLSMFA